MRLIPLLLALLAGLILTAPAAAASPAPPATTPAAWSQAGPYKVVQIEGEWRDARRDRVVPYLIRYPEGATGPVPVVIFSHGLGGSRRGAAYYGEHLASHGYVVVMVQHPGSDVSIWKGVRPDLGNVDRAMLARAVADPRVTLNRFFDIPFALDQLTLMNTADGPLKGHMDLTRIGMSGHSFGAVTTQAMAGQVYPGRPVAARAALHRLPGHEPVRGPRRRQRHRLRIDHPPLPVADRHRGQLHRPVGSSPPPMSWRADSSRSPMCPGRTCWCC